MTKKEQIMKIVGYNEKYVEKLIDIYIEFLAGFGEKWNRENSRSHLVDLGVKNIEKYSYFMLDTNENVIGGIFAGEFPVREGNILVINFLGIDSKHRGKGYGKVLFKHLFENINKADFEGAALVTNNSKKFPRDWYLEIGFEKDKDWGNYYVDMDKLNI